MTELRVGVLTLVSAVILVFGWAWTWDGVRPGEAAYRVTSQVSAADGLWIGTPVRVAGVEIGSVAEIGLAGTRAELLLDIREAHRLPVDSRVELRSTGMLGDRFVAIVPGTSATFVEDGGSLREGQPAFDMDAAGRQAQQLASTAGSSLDAVQALVTDEHNLAHIEQSLAQLAVLTTTWAEMSAQNRDDLRAVVANLRELSEALEALAETTAPDVERSAAGMVQATEQLNAILKDAKSGSGGIAGGEGTLGVLVRDRTLVDRVDRTLARAETTLDGARGWQADAWATSRVGASVGAPAGAPIGIGGTVGARVGPSRGTWLSTEIVAPATPGRAPAVPTLLLHQRWGPASAHLGLREGAEGVGGALHTARDRLRLQLDAFDVLARRGPRPSGVPNLRLGLRAEPVRHLWLEAVADELLAARPQGWIGLGAHLRSPRPPAVPETPTVATP